LLRGYRRNLIYSRLSDRALLASAVTAQSVRRGTSPQEAVERLIQQSNRWDAVPITSVYLMDLTGRVIAFSGEPVEFLASGRLASQAIPPLAPPVRGELRLDAGKRLLYVAEPVRASDDGQSSVSHTLILVESYRPMWLALGDLLPRLIWSSAIVLAVSLVLAALLAYSISRPLEHSRDAKDGGRVILRGECRDEWVLCSVTDNSPGIPSEELSRTFERFYQVEKSRVRRGSGAGLGLAIARGIVEGHRVRRIVAESVEGLGTRFVMELPALRA
jgi:hypothetical protein